MGKVAIFGALWVSLAALLSIHISALGDVHSTCRPFCHLPRDTHESCSSLRFLFPCINSVELKCNMDLHCSCEWSHAFDHIDSERMAIVRQSNVFQECDSRLREDCDEWKNKWSHIPCERVKKKTDKANSENPRLNLKLAEIRAGIMRLTDVARRRQLLSHLDQLIKRRPWEKVTVNETGGSGNSSSALRLLVERPRASAARGQHGNYTVMEWMDSIDSWHKKVLFEHWEKVSQADIVETLRRRRTFLLIFGVLTGGTAFIIVMLFVIKYQSDKNVRKDITFDGNLDSMVKNQPESFSFLDKLRKEKHRKGNKGQQPTAYQMNSLTHCSTSYDTKTKTDPRGTLQTPPSTGTPNTAQQSKQQQHSMGPSGSSGHKDSKPRSTPPTDPSTAPRTDPSTAPRSDPSTAPRTDPSTAPRSDPSTAPRSDPRTAPRSDLGTALTTDPSTKQNTDLSVDLSTKPCTDPSTKVCTEPRTIARTDSFIDHLVPVEAVRSSSSFDIGDQLFPSAMMRSFGADVNGSFLNVYQDFVKSPSKSSVSGNTITTSPEKLKENEKSSNSPNTSGKTKKPSTSKTTGTTSPNKPQETEESSMFKTMNDTEGAHVISLSRDNLSLFSDRPQEAHGPSTSRKLRPSQYKPKPTTKPMTSKTERSTSPALIPVTKVTTVKVSSKPFLSSSDSSSSSSSSSSSTSTSATTSTGSSKS